MSQKIATNKKAYQNFFLTDTIECGIELVGAEVKSVKAGQVNFRDSYAVIYKGQVWLHSLRIEPFAQASYMNPDPDRKRRLLLHKKEIYKLESKIAQEQLTLIPTKIYINPRNLVKVELALGKGKKMYDKRETLKKRNIKRSLDRAIKNYK